MHALFGQSLSYLAALLRILFQRKEPNEEAWSVHQLTHDLEQLLFVLAEAFAIVRLVDLLGYKLSEEVFPICQAVSDSFQSVVDLSKLAAEL